LEILDNYSDKEIVDEKLRHKKPDQYENPHARAGVDGVLRGQPRVQNDGV